MDMSDGGAQREQQPAKLLRTRDAMHREWELSVVPFAGRHRRDDADVIAGRDLGASQ